MSDASESKARVYLISADGAELQPLTDSAAAKRGLLVSGNRTQNPCQKARKV